MSKIVVNAIELNNYYTNDNILNFFYNGNNNINCFLITKRKTFLELIIYSYFYPTPMNLIFMESIKNKKNYMLCIMIINSYNIKIHLNLYNNVIKKLFINFKKFQLYDLNFFECVDIKDNNFLDDIKNYYTIVDNMFDICINLDLILNINNNINKIFMMLHYTFFNDIENLCNENCYKIIRESISNNNYIYNKFSLYHLIYRLCDNYNFVENVLINCDNIRLLYNDIETFGKKHNCVKIIIINIILKILDNHKNSLKKLTIFVLENNINYYNINNDKKQL